MSNARPTLAAVRLMLPAVRRVWLMLETDVKERAARSAGDGDSK